MKRFLIALLPALLAGCATTQYVHTEISEPAQVARQKAIDEAYCTQASVGTVPVPQIAYQPKDSGTYRASGTVSTYQPSTGYTTSTYSGTARKTPNAGASFSQSFANGANIGSAINARRAQDKIFHGCMVSRGWSSDPAAAGSQQVKASGSGEAMTEWQTTIDQFVRMEAARPDGIDYRKDDIKMMQLDSVVKQLASDPRNEAKTMQWFLVEADRIVKENYSPERALVQKK